MKYENRQQKSKATYNKKNKLKGQCMPIYNKLVRDRIPEIIENSDKTPLHPSIMNALSAYLDTIKNI